MFELEKAIKEWKRSLRKNSGYEDGDIEELESHLRDRMDDLIEDGKTKQEAFEIAAEEIGNVEEVATEFYKTATIKPYLDTSSGIATLLPNYIKIAWRNLIFRKGYSLINITGLSVGLAACMLIALYVQHEWSYDSFHENSDRSYLVLREFDVPGLQGTISYTPSALAPALEKNLSSAVKAVRTQMFSPDVTYQGEKFIESSFLLAEDGFFDIFSFQLFEGTSQLDRPNTVLLTRRVVPKYFGEEHPLGKTLLVGDTEMEVTGILENPPSNSHLTFDFIGSLNASDPDWGSNNYQTYLLLRPEQSADQVTKEINDIITAQLGDVTPETGNDFIPHLQPITDIHLGQGVSVEIGSEGNPQYLYLFIALAIFIIVLACINFMNLATARSMERAREVGMRKTLGGSRLQIAFQFLGESMLIALLASLLAVVIGYLILPYLNEIATTSLSFSSFFTLENLALLASVTLVAGLLAGGYPAFVLSSFQPSRVLKGVFRSEENTLLRKGLVVFQFTISITLLAGTGIIQKQIHYMKSSGLGFNPDNMLLVKQANFLGETSETFMNELSKIPGVENVSKGFSMPGTFFINSMWQADTPDSEAHNLDYSFVDFNYVETLELKVIAGRSFSASFESDSFAVMLNETAVRDFGWSPVEALEHKLLHGSTEYQIIGVLKDFNYRSLHSEVYPLALFGPRLIQRYVAVRTSPEANLPQIISELRTDWQQFTSLALDYSFLADDLKAQYDAEDRLIKVFGSFAGLAILVGCLGLFGLASFMVAQRTKEIGVRKVLGASTTQILSLLSTDLLKLVLIGFVIAVPLAVFLMNKWLEGFAYKTEMSWWLFLVTGIVAFVIALITVSSHALRAANMNPVNSLKSE
ncbi:MAG: ABC transporter permease [Balneola sp.]